MKTFAVLFALVAVAGMGCGDRNAVAPDPPITPETSDALRSVLIPVSGISTNVETIDPGERWTDDEGVFHIGGWIILQEVTGQDENGVPLTGIGPSIFNLNMDTVTGNGDFNGRRYDTVYTYGDLQGPFEGKVVGTYTEFQMTGHLIYHGSGDFDGWKYRATVTNVWASGQPTPFEGVLHNPYGN